MKFLYHFWNTIKPTVLRFPAAFLLSAMVAVFLSTNIVYSYGSYNFYLAMCLSCAWAFGLSVFLRLLLERLISSLKQKNTIFLLVQMVCIILSTNLNGTSSWKMSLIEQTNIFEPFFHFLGSSRSSGCKVGLNPFSYFLSPMAVKRRAITSA